MMSDAEEGNGKQQDAANQFAANAAAFTKFWSDMAGRMAGAAGSFAPGAPTAETVRQARSAMFKAMSDSCDEFMRSPEFQELMKQSLNASIQFRKRLNEWLGQMHHELQGVSRQDVDQLMQVMDHLEHRMTDGFERLSARLDAIEKASERGKQSAKRPPAAKHKAPRAKQGSKK